MRILLIQAPVANRSPHAQLSPPLGLAYVAATLLEAGHDVEVRDFNLTGLNPARLDYLLDRYEPQLVGISTHTETYPNAAAIAGLIKEWNPSVPVMLGGPHATILPRAVLEEAAVDFVAIGEGERTAVELAAALADTTPTTPEALAAIDGLGYKADGEIRINSGRAPLDATDIGRPARHLLSMELYEDSHNVLVARGGCPYRCSFCSGSQLWGGQRRMRPVGDVIAEARDVVDTYGPGHVFFVDDILTVNRRWLGSLMDALDEANLPITWGCATRVDCVDEALLRRMAEAGCTGIQFGVESGAQEILDSVKGIEKQAALNAVRWAVAAGIDVSCSFMIPFPDDTERTLAESAEFMRNMHDAGGRLLISYTTPFPGTRFYDDAEALGLRLLSHDWAKYDCKHVVMETRHLSAGRIEELAGSIAEGLGMARTA